MSNPSNPEDEGRFFKDFFRGVPTGYGLTRQEQILRTVTQGLQVLRDRLPQRALPASTALTAPQVIQSAPAPAPVVSVSVDSPARALAPHLEGIADEQRETNKGVGILTVQGARSIEIAKVIAGENIDQTILAEHAETQRRQIIKQTRLAVMVLESLDQAGREAYMQRLGIISGLYATREAIVQAGVQLGEGIEEVNANLLGLHEQGVVNIAELKRHTVLLDDIQGLEALGVVEAKMQTHSLQGIDAGVHDLVSATHENTGVLRGQTVVLERISGQLDVSNVIAAQAADCLARMADAMNICVITGEKTRKVLGDILKVLHAPIHTHAYEQWEIGEECRRVGDAAQAFRMFDGSNAENPAEPRNYYSLGLLCLEMGAIETARDFLTVGFNYAQGDPNLASLFLLKNGEVDFLKGRHKEAKVLLERALSLNKKNIDIWYALALVEMKLNNPEKAIYYLRNLILVARKKAPEYVQKILSDPEFSTILSHLSI